MSVAMPRKNKNPIPKYHIRTGYDAKKAQPTCMVYFCKDGAYYDIYSCVDPETARSYISRTNRNAPCEITESDKAPAPPKRIVN